MKTYYRRKFRSNFQDKELIYKSDEGIIFYLGKNVDPGVWVESQYKTIESINLQSISLEEIPLQEVALII